jgi:hypothetical protein
MRSTLILAGVYNLLWGAWVILFPLALFGWTGMEPPRYPQIWQCVGMIVGVYGVGYLLAARNPVRHWPIVLVGLLGKTLGPIGFLGAALRGELPWAWGATVVTNDLIWWVPFGAILFEAARAGTDSDRRGPSVSWQRVVREWPSHRGLTLEELSRERLVLLVFLRHAGCTFCREALSDLSRQRRDIEEAGAQLALVHMSEPLAATLRFSDYGLDDVHRFRDPDCVMYRAFGLRRGRFAQLLGAGVWWRGMVAGLWRGHGIGRLEGDGFRMPGVFLLHRGRILAEYRAMTAADRPRYVELVRRALEARQMLEGARRSSHGATSDRELAGV